jgi:gliding motility-associated-like protein
MATHERAGEITFRHLFGRTYEFTVTTYVYLPSPAVRPTLDVNWGDGSPVETVQRYPNYEVVIKDGLIGRNTYTAQHTYTANGTYVVSMEDKNRNAGIVNIPNSVNVPFYIETTVVISPFLARNSSPKLKNPPIDDGCVGVTFYHNPGAVDEDGDSLVYSLVACKGLNGEVIPGYTLPAASSGISIHPRTGDFVWDAPLYQGEYNIAIRIEEYRAGVKIGQMVRDMQITIAACNNRPPVLVLPEDTCVLAGTLISFTVSATDDTAQTITMTAEGDVFASNPAASFPLSVSGMGSLNAPFSWQTDCSHVRKNPYHFTVKAKDDYQKPELSVFRTMTLTVIAPPVEHVTATAFENTIVVTWNEAPCLVHAKGYKIYRRIDSSGYTPEYCVTGVPDEMGYQQIGTVDTSTRIFVDNKAGRGLLHGVKYCYVVIAYYADLSQSRVSNEACALLKRNVPMITQVSIEETDQTNGKIRLMWEHPLTLDSVQYPPPYRYTVRRSANDTLHFADASPYLSGDTTQFRDSLQNTVEHIFYYRIYMFSASSSALIGVSDMASSPFLTIDGSDCALLLHWRAETPWQNYTYHIYRHNDATGQYDSIGSSTQPHFTDTQLTNGQTYCYYIKTVGQYGDTTVLRPLVNLSQQVCASPVDDVPPCLPVLSGNGDCDRVSLQWTYKEDCRESDIDRVYISYKPDYASDYLLVDSVHYPTDYYICNNKSMTVGCFIVTAKDTNGNFSQLSQEICFDPDCAHYRLPNVFTPNGDGANDLFTPFPYDYVERIDIHIYNRWGDEMFSTHNPDVEWNGCSKLTGKPCSDGVYFYVCTVFVKTLDGEKKEHLTGSITIFR